MKIILCMLVGVFLITGCSSKMTKSELMNGLKDRNYCEGVACEEGLILEENMNRLVLACVEKTLEPSPNEITTALFKKSFPEMKRCIQTEVEFTPIVSKEKMLLTIMDTDSYERFSNFKPNMSRLELHNLVAHCYKAALEKTPPTMTMNQFKTVELNVQKCVFEK